MMGKMLEVCCLQMILWGLMSLKNSCRGLYIGTHCQKWKLKANVSESAIMTFGKGIVEGNSKSDLPTKCM